MKTASRVLGTAGLLDGFIAQDSPVYGAERRGAAMAAFTRLDRRPILERGVIARPDLVVIADDTLLDDETTRPLAGLPADGGVLVATAHSPEAVRRHTGHAGPLVARDFLSLALESGTRAAGLSTALAAAAAAMVGLSERAIRDAVAAELGGLGLDAAVVHVNLALAARARIGITALSSPVGPSRAASDPVIDVPWVPAEIGAPTVVARANTPLRRTGAWRVFRPVIDLGVCTRCWVCFARCPDGAIALDGDATPLVDYAVCKGCLVCVEECPLHAIASVREAREWPEEEPSCSS